ncbi:hypothetical protein FKM82_014475 [Ascaphus truei]
MFSRYQVHGFLLFGISVGKKGAEMDTLIKNYKSFVGWEMWQLYLLWDAAFFSDLLIFFRFNIQLRSCQSVNFPYMFGTLHFY